MSELLRVTTAAELARKCGLETHTGDHGSGDYAPTPAPWGIADAIRREVRRRSIVTRRELRNTVAPIMEAAGFTSKAWDYVRRVADSMVDVGEIFDLRVDNQRGYAARPSHWVRIGGSTAVILGVTATTHMRLEAAHPLQYLRRFNPQDADAVRSLVEQGVHEESFATWYGMPEWYGLPVDPVPDTLASLWAWHASEVAERGIEFTLDSTPVQAVRPTPGSFFGWPPRAGRGRWTSPASLPDGIYLGVQPGHHERHWRPLLILLANGIGRSLLLSAGPGRLSHWQLFCWLLIARGAEYRQREIIRINHSASTAKLTFPAPAQLRRCMSLCGESLGKWEYKLSNVADAIHAITSSCRMVEIR